jgi:hypothetical protein
MKYISLSLLLAMTFFACQPKQEKAQEDNTPVAEMTYHGEKISPDNALSFASYSGEEGEGVKLMGEVDKVCQAKGCWMTLKTEEGKSMRVTFKDYGFFVPKDISGKTAIVEGNVKVDTTSVEDLRHYAVDGGMTQAEADSAFTKPEVSLSFIASGVIIK